MPHATADESLPLQLVVLDSASANLRELPIKSIATATLKRIQVTLMSARRASLSVVTVLADHFWQLFAAERTTVATWGAAEIGRT